jgi:diadenosine tetraphosphate (Ap4A) HIT family hydrolase
MVNDRTFPWCVLVPARNDIREIHELEPPDQAALIREIASVSKAMQAEFAADKMNVAALGNVVPQLHVHIVARFEDDPAWPAPIWGRLPTAPYEINEQKQRVKKLRYAFYPIPGFRTTL